MQLCLQLCHLLRILILDFLVVSVMGRLLQLLLFDMIKCLGQVPVCLTGLLTYYLQLPIQLFDLILFFRQLIPQLSEFALHLDQVKIRLTLVGRPSSQQLLHALSEFNVFLFLVRHFLHVHFNLFVLDLELLFVVLGTVSLYVPYLQISERPLCFRQFGFEVTNFFVQEHMFLLGCHKLSFSVVKFLPHSFKLRLFSLVCPDEGF